MEVQTQAGADTHKLQVISNAYSSLLRKEKDKAIPVTGREGPYGCDTSRLQHSLDNRLTDGGEAVRLMRRLPFTPR
jgi:hypothetical protein